MPLIICRGFSHELLVTVAISVALSFLFLRHGRERTGRGDAALRELMRDHPVIQANRARFGSKMLLRDITLAYALHGGLKSLTDPYRQAKNGLTV